MELTVISPSRIHLGILDVKGDMGRLFGSVGIALEKPNFRVCISDSDEIIIDSPDERTLRYIDTMLKNLKNYCNDRRFKIEVFSVIPKHVGLGSGTQLALSIGYAITRFYNIDISIEEIARILGRGKVSGVGTYAFKYGGFIVDGGVDRRGGFPPLIFRYDIPKDWIFIIGIPNIERGVHGDVEDKLIREVIEYWRDCKKKLCMTFKILVFKMIPAILNRDIIEFGKAITLLDKEVGKMFSVVQGDVYRDEIIEKGIKLLLDNGAYGAGQSSWGPAFYGLVDSMDKAIKICRELERLFKDIGGTVLYTHANNIGVRIKEGCIYE